MSIQVNPQISQQSFDEAVKENIEEFEMTPEEALEDAVEQFKSQGVDLVNIIQRLPTDADAPHPVMGVLDEYKEMIASADTVATEKLKAVVDSLKEHMKEKPVHLLVGESGAIAVMFSAIDAFGDLEANAVLGVEAMNALVQGQPDLLGRVQSTCLEAASGETAEPTEEILRIIGLLKAHEKTPTVVALLLKTARFGCFMHESNRQAFVKAGLIEVALQAAEMHSGSNSLVVQAMKATMALVRDDDPRVPFGKANEHASKIAKDHDGLKRILDVLGKCFGIEGSNAATAAEIFRTLSQLASRDEFCKEIVDLGCLDFVLPALERHGATETVAHTGCSLLRAVAGNDEVKKIIGERGGIGLIIETMQGQLRSEKVAEQGSAALAALALKTPANAIAIAASNGPHVIVKTMYMHPAALKLQRQACMALRNVVVRNPELIDAVLGEGAESAINICLNSHKECKDEAKAALRDLNCKVQLTERWTGKLKTENLDLDGSVREWG